MFVNHGCVTPTFKFIRHSAKLAFAKVIAELYGK